jgi:hypothetical protein
MAPSGPAQKYWAPSAGAALAATAGIRAPMLAGAIPIAGVITLLAWRHRAHDLPN